MSVTVEWFDGSRDRLAALFALADDSAALVAGYRDAGRVLVAVDGTEIVGHLQLIESPDPGVVEVKSLAVLEPRHGQGIGRRLVEHAVSVCRREGVATLLVATAAADVGALRFYQRVRFRMLSVERDVFTPERGYPEMDVDGIPLRDQVWLSLAVD
ncbi:MAG: GNAT family N-acetyltransferase [Gaiellales bacterium]